MTYTNHLAVNTHN